MSIITEMMQKGKQFEDRVIGFFQANNVREILGGAGVYRGKGIPVMQVMLYLVSLVFTKKSMYMNMQNSTNDPGFGMDVVYRFLNSPFINWSGYLLKLAISVIKPIRIATSEERLCALVVDDSLFERSRSKCVELLANVHDHAEKGKNKFKRGFRMLTLGWTDGVSFIPLLYRHMSSQKKKSRYNEVNPNIDKRSCGYKARLQAISSTTEVLMWMLRQAKKAGVPAAHVLFDSWFSYPSNMMEMCKIGFHGVGMLKNTKTIKYLEGGAKKTLKEIYDSHRKRPGKSRYLLSVAVLFYNSEGETMPARIVFVRDRKNRKKWLAIGTTDMTISEESIIQLYGKRWDIEVFFKMCKSYLNLAKEFQGLSYDLITAHTAIVMTRYIMLAADKRHNEDPRTFTELFHSCYDEALDVTFDRALSLILDTLHAALHECLFLSESEISTIIDAFISGISTNFKDVLQKYKPLASAA
jgi:hypothetical protein